VTFRYPKISCAWRTLQNNEDNVMRGHVTRSLLLGILMGATGLAHAAFITDKIVVNVYAQRFDQGTVLKKLPSGTEVTVLMNDGQYSQVRTADNITGWVASTFLSNEKPLQLEYLDVLTKVKNLEAELKAAQEKPTSATEAAPPLISAGELTELQQRAKDAAWMRVELKKARDRADELEAQINAKQKTSTTSQQELDKLRADNKALEERLADALLVSAQPAAEHVTAAPMTVEEMISKSEEPIATAIPTTESNTGWRVKLEWFLGSLVITLIAGFIAGIVWFDNRLRQRHGGFRLY